jgi:hypothetical protein
VHRPRPRPPSRRCAAASPAAAPPAVAGCARSARTSPSNWSTCRPLQGDPPRAAQAGLRAASDLPGRRRRAGRSRAACPGRAAGACAGVQVLRPPAAVPAERHLRAPGRGAGALDAGRLGGVGRDDCSTRWCRRWAATCWPPRSCTPTTRRWVLQPGRGTTKTGRLWVLRARRPAQRLGDPPAVVPLLAGPQGRASAGAPEGLPRHPAGRRLCRLARLYEDGAITRGGVLGARAPWWDVPRAGRRLAGSPPRRCAHRNALRDRGRDPGQAADERRAAAPGARRAAARRDASLARIHADGRVSASRTSAGGDRLQR